MRITPRWAAVSVVAVSLLAGAGTLIIWALRGVYAPTGDEPHYLVIGDALWRFGGIDVRAAYESELASRVFYPPGLGDLEAALTTYGHVVPTESGDFSWHGYLLGWIVGLPVSLVGPEGARWAMVAIAAGIAWLVWLLSGFFFTSTRLRLAVAVTLVLTYPFLLASVLVFPDFVAGGLVLVGFAWLLARSRVDVARLVTVSAAFLVALLPWLGVKFTPIAALLLLAMAWRSGRRWWQVLIPAGVSAILFGAFNLYAYGSPFGSLTGGALEFTGDVWIRLAGMLIDQDQGALLFNPILWLGIAGVIPFIRRDRFIGVLWVLVFVGLWILGAAHPGWYGGGSFIGRYSWGLALLLMLPTMVTLSALHRRSRPVFFLVLIGSLVFSLWVAFLGLVVSEFGPGLPLGLDFFTKPMETWVESYSVLWYPIQDFLPALYDPAWAWGYGVNGVWLAILVLVLLGPVVFRGRVGLGAAAGLLAVVSIVMTGLVSVPGERLVEQREGIAARQGVDVPGVVTAGPVWLMRDGPYVWSVEYTSDLPEPVAVGRWELVRAMDESVVASGELTGTAGQPARVEAVIPYRSLAPRQYFLRVLWTGSGLLQVDATAIRHPS